MLRAQTILQNRYRIVRELGRGGMGAVYEAIDLRLTSKVALKEMLRARDEGARSAFEREAALLANLNHPNLPQVKDHFDENDGVYLVMQFIEGMDLAEWLDLRGEPFTQERVLQWADTLLDVLEYLHSHNPPILHRDIKPSNIKRTEDGRIYLLDFGLAKGSLGQMPTYETVRSIQGQTPFYSPLEQSHGSGTDPRSDLYSLGATVYHLISGIFPPEAGLRYRATEDDEPDPLLSPAKFISRNVASVIEKSISISPKQRHFSASEMRRALRHAADEDARIRLKDEYRQTEDRRRQREEEKKKEAEEAALQTAQEEQLRAAETLRRVTEDKQEARREEESERERRAPAKPQPLKQNDKEALPREKENVKQEVKDIPSTIPPVSLPTTAAELYKAPRAVLTTIPGPPPERLHTNQDGPAVAADGRVPIVRSSVKRAFGAVAGVVMLVLIISAIVFLYKKGAAKRHITASTQSPPQTMPQSNSTANAAGPYPKPPEGMVYVPGGTFIMGRNKEDGGDEYESPAHQVSVKPFFIDIYEVTNEDYEKFVKAKNRSAPSTWVNGNYPAGADHKPVTGVTWDDAFAYADWAGKQLPTEEQWEFAARGPKSLLYPWGNSWKAGCANTDIKGKRRKELANVGSYNCGSPFGTFDMIGNAWEWTTSKLTPYEEGRTLPDRPPGDLRVIRGASYIEDKEARATYRRGYPVTGAAYDKTGFRCAKEAPESQGQYERVVKSQ